ncbi:hypothetical protein ACFSSF_07110 [Dietzia aerolata]
MVGAGPADAVAQPVGVEDADLVEPDEQLVAGPAELREGAEDDDMVPARI